MMKTILATSVLAALASACAAPHHAATPARFPSRISRAALPAADRLATTIARDHHNLVTAQVRLCVLPSGAVGDVDLVKSSGLPAYDRAVIAAVSDWQYEAGAAPSCEQLSVSYRTP